MILENFNKKLENGKEISLSTNKESIDWERLELLRGELREVFESFDRYLNQIKGTTEISIDRGVKMSPEVQKQMHEIIHKFQPNGGNPRILFNMLGDLGSVPTIMSQNGLLVTAQEFNKKLEEIKKRGEK